MDERGASCSILLTTPQRVSEDRRKKARVRAERVFSTEAVVPQILEMYKEVLGRGKA
jgi:hypothetical protein